MVVNCSVGPTCSVEGTHRSSRASTSGLKVYWGWPCRCDLTFARESLRKLKKAIEELLCNVGTKGATCVSVARSSPAGGRLCKRKALAYGRSARCQRLAILDVS